jgi:NADH dehydrogenase
MKIIIVGGGFGGLKLARKLNNKKGVEILLIDKFNYHQFQPLFYQVATAGLDASNISFPLRKAFQNSKNIRIRITDLKQIVASENKIITGTGEEQYDILVLATGADTNFFGNQQLEEHAFPMKSTVEALQLRYKLVQNFEDALTTKNEEELQRLLNIVVVGGGPTGVEISGALAEMKKYVLPKDYPELDFSKMNIFLLEGTNKTLGHMSEMSSNRSKKYLEKLGVKVMTGSHVKDYDGKNILLQDEQTISRLPFYGLPVLKAIFQMAWINLLLPEETELKLIR